MSAVKTSSLRCEQLYTIWSTEPEWMTILDLRSKEEYDRAHIPGAVYTTLDMLEKVLERDPNKLNVLVVSSQDSLPCDKYTERENVVLLKDCERWPDMSYPLSGQAIPYIVHKTQKELTTMAQTLVFHQLFEPQSSTYTYLIADPQSRQAALIDPVIETIERDLKLITELGLQLMYVIDTHIHADHITAAGEIRKRTGAKTAVSRQAGVDCVDIPLEDGQVLSLGEHKLTAISTPGHTDTCMSFHIDDRIFTGDALLIRGSGRTDFQQGSAETLYKSVTNKIFKLPAETLIYPGHDYRGLTVTTVGTEKKHNPRLGGGRSLQDFVKIMSELKLAHPKKIDEAVPANLKCGLVSSQRVMHPQTVDGIPEVSVTDLKNHLGQVRMIDVRRPDEFVGELGHIPGAELVTLGSDLTQFLEKSDRTQEIIFVCRSGGRSGQATAESLQFGYTKTANMVGGMLRWNQENYPVERNK